MRSQPVGNGWSITRDHLDDIDYPVAKEGHVIEFKLYDDDGELYFTGKMTQKLHDAGEHIFDPLDWAMHDSGCTEMRINGETI